MSTIAVNAITDASGGSAASINGYTPSASNMTGRNRVINGAMMIDQRNAGASVTPTNGQYSVDRWKFLLTQSSKLTAQQSSTAPSNFVNSLLVTSSSAYSIVTSDALVLQQFIEGLNSSDLGWGTAAAKTVTLSFWVRSSLTGTFGGAVGNSAIDRSYPFSFTISSANTWEQKTVTIAGDTSGTWLTTSGIGIRLSFGLGVGATYSGTAGSWSGSYLLSATGATSVVGTSGATFYLTGVQLEVGSTASEFSLAGGTYPQELALCQRYYMQDSDLVIWMYLAHSLGANYTRTTVFLPTTMRANPTMSVVTSGAALGGVQGITPNMFTPYINGQSGSSHILSYTASAEL